MTSIYRLKISIITFVDNFISINIIIEKNIDKSYRCARLIIAIRRLLVDRCIDVSCNEMRLATKAL